MGPSPTAPELALGAGSVERIAGDTAFADAVHRLLTVARTQLRMKVAWVSEFVGSEQVLRFVDAEPGADAPAEGSTLPLSGSFCSRVLDGRFPRRIPDARDVPETALLDVTASLHIGAYVGVPLFGPTGVVAGMLCAIDGEPCPALDERDVRALVMLAQVMHDLQERALSVAEAQAQRAQLQRALDDVVDGNGRRTVLQPIVDLTTGRAVAAEGLTRFTARHPLRPGVTAPSAAGHWFDDAARLGLREDLELVTADAALDLLDAVPADIAVCVNLGPETLMTPRLGALLNGRDLTRVVLEITEHSPVQDYEALTGALQPYRAAGLRLAIDDAGSGYSSLRHVLAMEPDLVKVDMALTRGADADVARRTLLSALAGFASHTGCQLVAEGVETRGELTAVRTCGITLVQGYVLARPSSDTGLERVRRPEDPGLSATGAASTAGRCRRRGHP